MAFWNAPIPQEDPVYLACCAAMDMVVGAKALGDELQERFGIAGCGYRFRAAGLISIMLDTQRRDLMRAINDVVTSKEDAGKPYERFLLDPSLLLVSKGSPPIIQITSDEDLIKADSLKLERLAARGIGHELVNYPKGGERELVHVFAVGYPMYPESRDVLARMDAFFKEH